MQPTDAEASAKVKVATKNCEGAFHSLIEHVRQQFRDAYELTDGRADDFYDQFNEWLVQNGLPKCFHLVVPAGVPSKIRKFISIAPAVLESDRNFDAEANEFRYEFIERQLKNFVVKDGVFLAYGSVFDHMYADEVVDELDTFCRVVDAFVAKDISYLKEFVDSLPNTKRLKDECGFEDENDVFGRIMFAHDRNRGWNRGAEPDTDVEMRIGRALRRYFASTWDYEAWGRMKDEDIEVLRSCLDQGKYSDIIVPLEETGATHVYRGIAVSQQWFARLMGVDLNDIDQLIDECMKNDVSVSCSIKNDVHGISSWSTNAQVARDFAKHALVIDDQFIAIVMRAAVADNPRTFLAGKDGLYRIRSFSANEEEEEALAIRTIKCDSVKCIRKGSAWDK